MERNRRLIKHFILSTPIVEIRNLSKNFKGRQAVDNLSFSIHPGDVYGFLGQNGAGKSTTMRMLLGLIFPDSGQIFINGEEFNNSRRRLLRHIGAIIERPDMYGYLSGWDNLRIMAALTQERITDSRIYDVLEQVGLRGREKDKVKTYSQGMKQRLGIAIALVHQPDLLILDEPTNGLDPQGIAEMRQLILSLSRDHGKTVLVSSHLLHEIEQVATRMLVLHKGKKIAEGPVTELINPDDMLIDVTTRGSAEERVRLSEWSTVLVGVSNSTLTFKMNAARVPELNKWLVEQGVAVMEIRSKHSLEDYFIAITQ